MNKVKKLRNILNIGIIMFSFWGFLAWFKLDLKGIAEPYSDIFFTILLQIFLYDTCYHIIKGMRSEI